MGHSQLVRGHVGGVARGINVPNAQPDQPGLASVNPIFTWVRLAQRVPVRIDIDQTPKGVRLVAGMTATVQIDPIRTNHTGSSPRYSGRKWGQAGTICSGLFMGERVEVEYSRSNKSCR